MKKTAPFFILLLGVLLITLAACKKRRGSATAISHSEAAEEPLTPEAKKTKETLMGKWILTKRYDKKVTQGKVDEGGDSTVISIDFQDKKYEIKYLKTAQSNLWTAITGGNTETFSGVYSISSDGKAITLNAPNYVADVMAKWVGVIALKDTMKILGDSILKQGGDCNTKQAKNLTDLVDTALKTREAKALAGLFPNNVGSMAVALGGGLAMREVQEAMLADMTAIKLSRIAGMLMGLNNLEAVRSKLTSWLKDSLKVEKYNISGQTVYNNNSITSGWELKTACEARTHLKTDANKVTAANALAQQALIKNFLESYGVSFANGNQEMTFEAKDTRYLTFDTSAAKIRPVGATFTFSKQ